MQNVDAVYRQIIELGNYETETKLIIAGIEYGEDKLIQVSTSRSLFPSSSPTVGGCVSGEITCVLFAESENIPRMAKIEPYVRIKKVINNIEKMSGWIHKGVFYADTREVNLQHGIVTIHGFDAMLAMEAQYTADISMSAADAVNYILGKISAGIGEQIQLSSDTSFGYSFNIPKPASPMSMRTVMGNIAAAYAGNWIFTDTGKLRLIKLNTMPTETFYLVSKGNDTLTYGGDRIVLL